MCSRLSTPCWASQSHHSMTRSATLSLSFGLMGAVTAALLDQSTGSRQNPTMYTISEPRNAILSGMSAITNSDIRKALCGELKKMF
ncbi:hypothetical protein BGZ60DRAFT_410688 [Tricladium varicosporioides]|nr:hypothetical protein BGZ60DRAFT_410688 [Hymenoscyphus varicosporioides]